METELILSVGGFPPFSARECQQELKLLNRGGFRRSIKGELIYLGSEDLKYQTIISCKDRTTLATDNFSPGITVEVGCIQKLWQEIHPPEEVILLRRPPVKGSIVVINTKKELVKFESLEKQKIKILDSFNERLFISYRPWLKTKIISFSLTTEEWELKGGWKLELEEI